MIEQGATSSHGEQQQADAGAMDDAAGQLQGALQGGEGTGDGTVTETNSSANEGKAGRRKLVVKRTCAACASTSESLLIHAMPSYQGLEHPTYYRGHCLPSSR